MPDLRHRPLPDSRQVSPLAPLASQSKAILAAQAALAKQAEGVVVMDLRALSTVTDYFVICTAETAPQMTAVREQIERAFAGARCPIWHTEGSAANGSRSPHEPQWLLMDCGDVVVHLLDPPARTLYRLEEMWADAPRVSVPPVPASAVGRPGPAPAAHRARAR